VRRQEHVVCRLSDLADGTARVVDVAGTEVAVFRVGEDLFAIENSCPHRGGPLGHGDLRGRTVFCPVHAWPFDLVTGRCLEFPDVAVRRFAVRVRGDEVRVEL